MAGPGAGWKHGGASLTDRADVGQPGVGMARMAEVINLKAARKAKAQAARETQAAANRAAFGRTKAERVAEAAEAARRAAVLDGAKRECIIPASRDGAGVGGCCRFAAPAGPARSKTHE